MSRYDQFPEIVAKVKPKTIIEIGAHQGRRAVYLVKLALEYQRNVDYTGYDIFEAGGRSFQKAALNGKGIAVYSHTKLVMQRLSVEHSGRFSWHLISGDTRKTLVDKNLVVDLVFIDGDHRLETIRSDYDAVKDSRCIVFDDYFLPDDRGVPDLSLYGANRVVDEIPGAVILPIGDPSRDSGISHMAVVYN